MKLCHLQQQGWSWRFPDRGKHMSYDIAYMWYQKNDTNELIHKTEVDPQTQKQNYGYQKRKRKYKFGVWG